MLCKSCDGKMEKNEKGVFVCLDCGGEYDPAAKVETFEHKDKDFSEKVAEKVAEKVKSEMDKFFAPKAKAEKENDFDKFFGGKE